MPRLIVLALVVASACSKRTADDRDRDQRDPSPPLRVVFGPCVGLSGSPVFTSGWRQRGAQEPAPSHTFGAHDSNIASPLRAIERDLRECAKKEQWDMGIGVVELGEFPRLVGMLPSPPRPCFVNAAHLARGQPERCGFAFGTERVDDGHTVRIRADAIVADGAPVADPRAIIADPDPIQLDRLRAALALQIDVDAGDALRIHVPTSLHPLDNTRMKVVNAVVAEMRRGSVEPLLTAQDGTGWRSLPLVELPAVPLPPGYGPPKLVPANDPRMLALIVANDAIAIRFAPANDRVDIPKLADLGHDWDRVLAELRRYRGVLGNRDDLQIVGEDDVEYIDVTRAIDVATSAGFAEWRLVVPSQLPSRL